MPPRRRACSAPTAACPGCRRRRPRGPLLGAARTGRSSIPGRSRRPGPAWLAIAAPATIGPTTTGSTTTGSTTTTGPAAAGPAWPGSASGRSGAVRRGRGGGERVRDLVRDTRGHVGHLTLGVLVAGHRHPGPAVGVPGSVHDHVRTGRETG